MEAFVVKGDFVFSESREKLHCMKDGYLLVENGHCGGLFERFDTLPETCKALPLRDYSGKLIVPGLTDLHIHAPQYMYRGLWMDMELLDWLNRHTFPEEARFRDLSFAETAYRQFAEDMRNGGTTRLCVFGTIHTDATLCLMDLLEAQGLRAYVGKVNMDRNSPDILRETTEESISETKRWLQKAAAGNYRHVKPILSPRFIPSCTDRLMKELGDMIREQGFALQSHLSENQSEVEWVKELCPWSKSYGDAYDRPGCFGGEENPTIMAHCVWCSDEEIALMKKNHVFVAHSPSSNTNLSSGIAPVRKYLDEGVQMGLATDVAGGSTRSIFRVMADAVQVSKLYWRLIDQTKKPLTMPEAFYLGTKGGGAFFGKCGSFEKGYAADILVLDESRIPTALTDLSLEERLERFVYLGDDRDVLHKYIEGEQLF